jgi:hypothetical protein
VWEGGGCKEGHSSALLLFEGTFQAGLRYSGCNYVVLGVKLMGQSSGGKEIEVQGHAMGPGGQEADE